MLLNKNVPSTGLELTNLKNSQVWDAIHYTKGSYVLDEGTQITAIRC